MRAKSRVAKPPARKRKRSLRPKIKTRALTASLRNQKPKKTRSETDLVPSLPVLQPLLRLLLQAALLRGTLAPFLRALERPIAIACLRLLIGCFLECLPERM